MPDTVPRLTAAGSWLLVVDVQETLLAKVPGAADLVRAVGLLIDAAGLLGVEVRATEQYPKGLGPTAPEVAGRLPSPPVAKTAFSAAGAVGRPPPGRPTVVVVGLETHICVAQTALDLLAAGAAVFVPVDAVGSRFVADHGAAVRRLERAGAVVTTAEAVVFEWVGDAAHPWFKVVSRLVVERAATRPGPWSA